MRERVGNRKRCAKGKRSGYVHFPGGRGVAVAAAADGTDVHGLHGSDLEREQVYGGRGCETTAFVRLLLMFKCMCLFV